jgi:uridine kinase
VTSSPFVTAVSGVSGAGKTSLTDRTVALLGDAVALHFDDYASVSTYPTDLRAWMHAGADVDAWKTPRLSEDLARRRAGEAIELPRGGRIVEPSRWILIEEPFARLRREMTGLIDLAVYIDLQGDVLLARRLLRRIGEERHQFGDALLERIQRDLEQHVSSGHELDRLAATMIRDSADLLLDGRESVDTLARKLADTLASR